MKKIIIGEGLLLVLLALVMFVLLSGKSYRADVSASEVTAIAEKYITDESFTANPGSALEVKKYFNINVNDYAQFVYYAPSHGMDVSEFLWIDAGSASQAQSLAESMASRVETLKKAFEGYGESQMALLNKAQVFSVGNYAIYMVSDNSAAWKAEIVTAWEE